VTTFPKIELHVHFEGTVRPATLRELAQRNGVSARETDLDEFGDFAGFIRVFESRLDALKYADDFRRIVVEYAEEAARHGAVYLEGIFTPGLWRGLDTDEVFSGYCDGARDARERYGVEVRLTPDIPGPYSLAEAQRVVDYALEYRNRGIVGVGLAGLRYDPEQFVSVFARVRAEGLASVPHAGEHAGAESVRAALDVLGADRIRHGIRAADDPALLAELAERGIVCDVCPISNVRTGAVAALEAHPLPKMVGAGVRCSISTDDPAIFDTDLTREYAVAAALGVEPRAAYEAGVAGATCDEATKQRLREIGETFDWSPPAGAAVLS
jgi:aminodeoxyfutalosine deaminase